MGNAFDPAIRVVATMKLATTKTGVNASIRRPTVAMNVLTSALTRPTVGLVANAVGPANAASRDAANKDLVCYTRLAGRAKGRNTSGLSHRCAK